MASVDICCGEPHARASHQPHLAQPIQTKNAFAWRRAHHVRSLPGALTAYRFGPHGAWKGFAAAHLANTSEPWPPDAWRRPYATTPGAGGPFFLPPYAPMGRPPCTRHSPPPHPARPHARHRDSRLVFLEPDSSPCTCSIRMSRRPPAVLWPRCGYALAFSIPISGSSGVSAPPLQTRTLNLAAALIAVPHAREGTALTAFARALPHPSCCGARVWECLERCRQACSFRKDAVHAWNGEHAR